MGYNNSSNDLFRNMQFGFKKDRSTVLQLLKNLDSWTEILDDHGWLHAVYIDFMKTFNKVPHVRLIHKVDTYGIKGPVKWWIECFLDGRKQRVMVNGEASDWRLVTSGIPQGTVHRAAILCVVGMRDEMGTLARPSVATALGNNGTTRVII
jgi:hypothetical protein